MFNKKNNHKQSEKTHAICIVLLIVAVSGILFLKYPDGSITGRVVTDQLGEAIDAEYKGPSQDEALLAILSAEKDLTEMQKFNLSYTLITNTLLVAQQSFIGRDPGLLVDLALQEQDTEIRLYIEKLIGLGKETSYYEINDINYSKVILKTDEIHAYKVMAFELLDQFDLGDEKIKEYEDDKINISRGLAIYENSRNAFTSERYVESKELLEQSLSVMNKASIDQKQFKTLVHESRNFFIRNWLEILLIIVIISVVAKPIYQACRRKYAQYQYLELKKEYKSLRELLKNAQIDCFKDEKISEATYMVRHEKYMKRMAEIKHTLPVLQNIFTGKKKSVKTKKRRPRD